MYLLFSVLLRNETLETLNISGCGFTSEAGKALAEVLCSSCVKFQILSLDVSNNDFGPNGIDNRLQNFCYLFFILLLFCILLLSFSL